MAKVLEDQKLNLSVYIYSDDHEPSHVHVFIGKKKSREQANIKINLGDDENPPTLINAHSKLTNKSIKEALLFIAEHQDLLLEKWRNIHGKKEMEDGGTDG